METGHKIEIFRPGRHTTVSGEGISFSEADVSAIAAGYDPDLHQAPLVIGHPKTDDPAFGWVKDVAFSDGILVADAVEVDPAFAEIVNKGRFRKVSASFYKPDAGGNPNPGSWYLRHVGFLGAAAPAVKGLKAVSFAEDGDDIVTVDFGEHMPAFRDGRVANLFRGIRDLVIEKFGLDTADNVLPAHSIDFLQDSAASDAASSFAETKLSRMLNRRIDAMEGDRTGIIRRMASAAGIEPGTVSQILNGEISRPPDGRLRGFARVLDLNFDTLKNSLPAEFSEQDPQPKETKTMPDENKAAELEARSGELDTRDADLKTREGDQEKRETEFAERQQQLKETEIGTFLDGIIKDGKLAPGKKDALAQFMAALDDSGTVQFAEEGAKETPLAFIKGLLSESGKVVDFSEASGNDGRDLPGDASGTDIARAAAEFQESEKAAGRTVDAATAVAHIRKQGTSK